MGCSENEAAHCLPSQRLFDFSVPVLNCNNLRVPVRLIISDKRLGYFTKTLVNTLRLLLVTGHFRTSSALLQHLIRQLLLAGRYIIIKKMMLKPKLAMFWPKAYRIHRRTDYQPRYGIYITALIYIYIKNIWCGVGQHLEWQLVSLFCADVFDVSCGRSKAVN